MALADQRRSTLFLRVSSPITTSTKGNWHTNPKRERGMRRVTRGRVEAPSLALRVGVWDQTGHGGAGGLTPGLVVFSEKCQKFSDSHPCARLEMGTRANF